MQDALRRLTNALETKNYGEADRLASELDQLLHFAIVEELKPIT
jgi:hypothetical protein